jgi:KDO2-lipid IV(A) lauroyltransferase
VTTNAADIGAAIPAEARPVLRGGRAFWPGWLRNGSVNFWREFMYWWADRFPPFMLWTQAFFLWFANRYSVELRDGPLANARRILGPGASQHDIERLRRAIIKNAYWTIYEVGRANRLPIERLAETITIQNKEIYAGIRGQRRGAILVTAHFGPFEVGSAALLGQERKVHVVYVPDARKSFDRLRTRLRHKLGISEVPLDGDVSIWFRLRDALLNDEVVLIQGDRVLPGHRGVEVPFMGGHVELPTGPAKLAMATGSPIVPIFSIRTQLGRCRVEIDEPIEVKKGADRVTSDHPAVVAMARALERRVQAYPEQWMVYERVWREDQLPS